MPYDVGKTLKKHRLEAKMSVKQISEILLDKGYKATESTIYSWENGNSQPTPGALLLMCRTYGIKDVLTAFGYDGYNDDGSLCLNIQEIKLIEKYRQLNEQGKDMLNTVLHKKYFTTSQPATVTEFPKTPQKDTDHLTVQAAHARTDIEVTDEMRKHDSDIMNDDAFWNS